MYIAVESSTSIADRFIRALYRACEKTLLFPAGYPLRQHLAPGLRVVFHGPYAIYFQHNDHAVTIVRVLHGARDIGTIAEEGGFE